MHECQLLRLYRNHRSCLVAVMFSSGRVRRSSYTHTSTVQQFIAYVRLTVNAYNEIVVESRRPARSLRCKKHDSMASQRFLQARFSLAPTTTLDCEESMKIQARNSYRPPLPPIILSLSGCIPPCSTVGGPWSLERGPLKSRGGPWPNPGGGIG